jgi:hypothetical protein
MVKILIDQGALQMVVNALRRDAADGRAVRGEMANELLQSVVHLVSVGYVVPGGKSILDHPPTPDAVPVYTVAAGHGALWEPTGGSNLRTADLRVEKHNG